MLKHVSQINEKTGRCRGEIKKAETLYDFRFDMLKKAALKI